MKDQITEVSPQSKANHLLDLLAENAELKCKLAVAESKLEKLTAHAFPDTYPLYPKDLLEMGRKGLPVPAIRALATFGNEANWVQIYDGHTSPVCEYQAAACEWAFIGGVRPPYELAQHSMSDFQKLLKELQGMSNQMTEHEHLSSALIDVQMNISQAELLGLGVQSRLKEAIDGITVHDQYLKKLSGFVYEIQKRHGHRKGLED